MSLQINNAMLIDSSLEKRENNVIMQNIFQNIFEMKIIFSLFSNFFLAFAFNFAILLFIFLLFLSCNFLVLLVLCIESFFGVLVDLFPHFADYLSQIGNSSVWVLFFHLIVHLSSKEEECRQGFFRWSWL